MRLISGIVLTIFLVGHFINHALGIISIKAMNDALKYFIQPWRDPVGEAVLMLALLVHVVLALHALYARRTLTMKWNDSAQLVSGFMIPILLGAHVLGTRGLHEAFGVVEGYQFTLYSMWIPSNFYGILNIIAVPVVWVHTCLGWHYWLRLKAWYRPLQIWVLGFAIVLPTLALAGYASASFRVARLSNSEKWVDRLFSRTKDQFAEMQSYMNTGETAIWISVPAVIALIMVLRYVRAKISERGSSDTIEYRDLDFTVKHELKLMPDVTLLEQFRMANIDHASVCGGRGRCSTCRVRVDKGLDDLEPAGANEQKVLARIKASPDVRLACQVKAKKSLSVTALLNSDAGPQQAQLRDRIRGGDEQEIAVLFADIREFTKLSETRLPFDTAFLLNRYFASTGRAIEEAGGHLDKFIGDGVMALFGVDESLEEGCRKAILAAVKMSEQLKELNESLKGDLDQELRIGIGIHCGTAIVGKMGYNKAIGLTAIGDVVNTASRLESLTKEHGVQFIVSDKTITTSGLSIEGLESAEVNIRGREQALKICMANKATDLGVG